jgi:DNA-directed RNA polymerase sigma subunit (sigma70/sigma32)
MGKLEEKREMINNAEAQDDGMTHAEIAKVLGITPNAVRALEKTALMKLKAPNEKNRALYDYWQIKLRPTERVDI